MPGSGAGVSNVRGAETDPMSVMACGRVVAGISRRGLRTHCQLGVAVGTSGHSGPPMGRLQVLQRIPP